MKNFPKIFSIITVVLTIYVAVFAGIMVIPRVFGTMPYIVQSGSMAPMIPAGSIAFINQKDRDVEIDDIITYRLGEEASIETGSGAFTTAEEGMLVTHRVIDISDDGYLMTKGDANEVADLSYVNISQVVGTYKFHIPKLGFFMSKLNKRMMLAIFAGIVMLNIASSILSWAWESENKKMESETRDRNQNDQTQNGETPKLSQPSDSGVTQDKPTKPDEV